MAVSLLLFDSGLYSSLCSRSDIRRNLSCYDSPVAPRKVFRLQSRRCSTVGLKLRYELRKGEGESSAEEPPELLFMKELRKRRMTPASILEDSNRSMSGQQVGDPKAKEDEGMYSGMNAVSTDIDESLSNQRERSMALNSEGLEGLIPRAKLLLGTGGTFFVGFWPFILITVALFSALYIYFGHSFLHDASKIPASPLYTNSHTLLDDERMSQTVHHVN